MGDNGEIVDTSNVWCENLKKDLEKLEAEYNEMIVKFNSIVDNYSISTEYSKLVDINQVFGEISILIHVGRELFRNTGVDFVEYQSKFAEQVFNILNVSADTIHRILNREEPADSMFFYGAYRNLKNLVYEMLNKRVSH